MHEIERMTFRVIIESFICGALDRVNHVSVELPMREFQFCAGDGMCGVVVTRRSQST